MAKVITQTIAINVSKLVKETDKASVMVSRELVTQLEELVSELVKDAVVEAMIVE